MLGHGQQALCNGCSRHVEGFIKRPTLIQDRFQERVYSNEFWNEAVSTDPTIDEIVHAASTDNTLPRNTISMTSFSARKRLTDIFPWRRAAALEHRFFARDRSAHVDQGATALDNFT